MVNDRHKQQHPRVAKWILAIVLVGLSVVIGALPDGIAASQDNQPVTTPSPGNPPRSVNDLIQQAQTTGEKVRVIIRLNTAFQSPNQLSVWGVLLQQAVVSQSHAVMARALAPYGAQIAAGSERWSIPFMAVEVDAAALQYLASSPQVAGIVEDQIRAVDNNYSSLVNQGVWNGSTWARGFDGTGYTVAIVDTGVKATHDFISPKVVAEYCASHDGTYPGYQLKSLCPGGVTSYAGVGAADPANCDAIPFPYNLPPGECDHGTHVAGIAAGKDSSGVHWDGVARGANIIAAQVFTDLVGYCLDQNSQPYNCALSFDSDQISALDYIYSLRNQYKIAAVNMSLGSDFYNNQSSCDFWNSGVKAEIDLLRSANIATVIASGNGSFDTGIGAPGCISSAIGVGSYSDSDGKISNFSDVHPMLDLLASGEYIDSSVPNNSYAYYSGTSMATPQVTGAWAVMRQAFPNASVTQILQTFQQTGTPVRDDARSNWNGYGTACYGYDPNFDFTYLVACSNGTYKLINVAAAIDSLMPAVPNLNLPADFNLVNPAPALSWFPASKAAGYEIQIDTVNPPFAAPIVINSTSYRPPSLASDVRYFWRVRSLKLGGHSDWSETRSFAINSPPPRNFFTTDTPTLTWNRILGAVRYEVQVAYDTKFTNLVFPPALNVSAPALSMQTPHLDDGVYYWRVRGCSSATICGAYSGAEAITVDVP
jgi:subtilisin family serine protease